MLKVSADLQHLQGGAAGLFQRAFSKQIFTRFLCSGGRPGSDFSVDGKYGAIPHHLTCFGERNEAFSGNFIRGVHRLDRLCSDQRRH